MADFEDVFRILAEDEACQPQIRVYIESEMRPPHGEIVQGLPDYRIFLPRSTGPYEIALIRKIAVESEEQFQTECSRVAAILAPLLAPESSVRCVYDNDRGGTEFVLALRKSGDDLALVD